MARHYDKWARRQGLQAYRIYDADLDEYPVTVDRYGENLYVAIYAKKGQALSEDEMAGFTSYVSRSVDGNTFLGSQCCLFQTTQKS